MPARQRRLVVEHRALEPARQQLGADRGDDRVLHRDARPGRRQAHRLPAVGDDLAARDLARELAEQLLGQRHQVLVRRVGLVELEHRELGVVLARQPLVAEVAADLVDALEAADDQALEVELGRDAHVEIEIQRVVVGLERPRRGAAQDRVHHRRLDLEEAARVEEAPDRAHDRACACGRPRARRGSPPGRRSAGGSGSRRPAGRATSRAAAASPWSARWPCRRGSSARRCA